MAWACQDFDQAHSFSIAAVTTTEKLHTSELAPVPELTLESSMVHLAFWHHHPFSYHQCPASSFPPPDALASVSTFPFRSAPPSSSLAVASEFITANASFKVQPIATAQQAFELALFAIAKESLMPSFAGTI